jgi:hypothetical protein
MRRAERFAGCSAAVLFLAMAGSSFATETAEVTRAEGLLTKWVSSDSSPVPICNVEWRHVASEGTEFHAVPADYFSYDICNGELMVHCGADTLAFTGWWPESDVSGIPFFRRGWLRSTLDIDLTVIAPTAVTATRHWAGDIEVTRHEVTVTTPDGESTLLLAADDPADEAQRILPPGTYGIRIDVDVRTYYQEFGAYSGDVTVVWVDAATPTQPTTWGEMKARYR